jgi:hypothetical protein
VWLADNIMISYDKIIVGRIPQVTLRDCCTYTGVILGVSGGSNRLDTIYRVSSSPVCYVLCAFYIITKISIISQYSALKMLKIKVYIIIVNWYFFTILETDFKYCYIAFTCIDLLLVNNSRSWKVLPPSLLYFYIH